MRDYRTKALADKKLNYDDQDWPDDDEEILGRDRQTAEVGWMEWSGVSMEYVR